MRFLTSLLAALLMLACAAPAGAVSVYLTPDQGFPFLTPDDPREVDSLGPDFGEDPDASGPDGPFLTLTPQRAAQRLNLWVDPEGETLTYLGLRLVTNSVAPFTDWTRSATLSFTTPDSSAIVGRFLTISNIAFNGHCNDASGLSVPVDGAAQGSCAGSGPGNFILNGDPDQTAPMLLGTLMMDLSGLVGDVHNFILVQIVTGQQSSYIAEGQPEQPFELGTLLIAGNTTGPPLPVPEPAGSVLLGIALAALATRAFCHSEARLDDQH